MSYLTNYLFLSGNYRHLYTVILRALASDNYNYIRYTGLLTYNRYPTPNLT